MAGVWTGGLPTAALGWLIGATSGLYAGGVVLNDVFDAPLDRVERPERPIPQGHVSRGEAAALGLLLLAGGTAAAWQVGFASGLTAAGIAVGTILYDGWAKEYDLLGPIVMGACRGGNLLLGVTLSVGALAVWWPLAALPVVYIGAITSLSRGEVHGGSRNTAWTVVFLFGLVIGALLVLGASDRYVLWMAVPFVLVLGAQVGPPLLRAAREPTAARIREAVGKGVLGIVALDATLAAGFGGWVAGIVVLLIAGASWGLSQLFAVT